MACQAICIDGVLWLYLHEVGFVLCMSQSGLQTCPMPPARCCLLDASIHVQLEILFFDDGLGHLQRMPLM